jgi:hypothetical protein
MRKINELSETIELQTNTSSSLKERTIMTSSNIVNRTTSCSRHQQQKTNPSNPFLKLFSNFFKGSSQNNTTRHDYYKQDSIHPETEQQTLDMTAEHTEENTNDEQDFVNDDFNYDRGQPPIQNIYFNDNQVNIDNPHPPLGPISRNSLQSYIEESSSFGSASNSSNNNIKNSNSSSSAQYQHHYPMGDEGIIAIAKAIQSKSFTSPASAPSLVFKDHRIGPLGGTAIGEALASTSTCVKDLDLQFNRIGCEGTIGIANILKNPITRESSSKVRKKKNVEEGTNLSQLQLGCNEIGDEGALALADALQTNTSLLRLDLCKNDIRYVGLRAIVMALSQNSASQLKELNLAWNAFDNEHDFRYRDATDEEDACSVVRLIAQAMSKSFSLKLITSTITVYLDEEKQMLIDAHVFPLTIDQVIQMGSNPTPCCSRSISSGIRSSLGNYGYFFHNWKILSRIRCPHDYNRLPLHRAILLGIGWNEGTKYIMEAYPAAVLEEDCLFGLPPFMLAAATTPACDLDSTYELLRANPSALLCGLR